MLRQKIFLFIILFFTVFFATAGYSQEAVTKLKEYGIDDLDSVKMSYRHEGGHSITNYVWVEIQGDGRATCAFKYINSPEEIRQRRLEKTFIEDLIKLYAKLDFFKFKFERVTESFVYDAGDNTLTYQFKDKKRDITYAAIKTKAKGRLAVPATLEGKFLCDLQSMYWKIILQEEYLYTLKDYRKMNLGVLANELSSLDADIREKRVLNPEEFLPIIMEIISHEDLRKVIGQYAAGALEEASGVSLPGDWWDCERWLKWWEENKDKYNVSNSPFTLENIHDYKEYDPYSGKTNLKVEVDLEVNKEGEYRLNSFLLGATVKDESGEEISVYDGKDAYLSKGRQKITFSFDGQRIFESKFSSYKFYLNTTDFEKTITLSTPYNYQEFRQRKVQVIDKDKDFSEIAAGLVALAGFITEQYSPKVEEVKLDEIFGEGIASSDYFLYEVDTTVGLIPTQKYVAVAKDKTCAFIIQGNESFNDLILSLNFSSKQDNDYIKITQVFLEIMPRWNISPEILWQLPEPDKTWGSGGSTFKEWFNRHEDYQFHPPQVKRAGEAIEAEYYTWEDNAGILKKQHFQLNNNGTIIEYKVEELGERIGNYVII